MILILNGPSGSGKTELGNYFSELGINEIISTTTREPRVGEIDGVDYHFVSKEEFLKLNRIEESIYSGNYYGVTKEEVDKKVINGETAFAVLDINGVKAFKELYGDLVKVIYLKVSRSKMEKRMRLRGDSWENIIKRLKNSTRIGEGKNYLHADFIIDNNDDLKSLRRSGKNILKSLGIKIPTPNKKA